MKIKYDKETKKWLKAHPGTQSTMCRCSKCGLFYKARLGHKCKVKGANDE